jgi:ADP-dependent NAD(P)H-hydrate dehydratase / NAD(P)H-hydrate epimerase
MIPVLTADQMRTADRRTIEEHGVAGSVLMENAGRAVAEAIRARYPRATRPLILCGKGNNGGDGFVVARLLLGLAPRVLLVGPRGSVKGDALLELSALEGAGGTVEALDDEVALGRVLRNLHADLLVDALLGTGLKEAPSGLTARVIADIGAWAETRRVPVVAVDLPSGVPSDGGVLTWRTMQASLTVCFAAPKWGHALAPASERCGEVLLADIGIPRALLAGTESALGWIEAADVASLYPRRAAGSHKGTYGHLLVVAGSVGKTGAAVLAAAGALRSGAGLVTVATPSAAQTTVASSRAELMTVGLPSSPEGTLTADGVEQALALATERDAVVLGPGLGADAGVRAFVEAFVARCSTPVVIDADALNALASSPDGAAKVLGRRAGPTVVTPHPGEMARLASVATAAVQVRRLETARDFAQRSGATAVLKGHRTLVSGPDGRTAVNPTGNPGMAKAGSGDVLAGTVGALLARRADPFHAACAAVYLHGLAGDLAAESLGVEGMLAQDLIEALPVALRAITAHG